MPPRTIGVRATITGQATVATNPTFAIIMTAEVQPALGSDFMALLQNPQVQVQSDDKLLRPPSGEPGR
jgi:hypothetical protein